MPVPGCATTPRWGRATGKPARGTSASTWPCLTDIPLRAITPAVVREWYAAAMRGKGGRTSIQQSYRFLHAVLALRCETARSRQTLQHPWRWHRSGQRTPCCFPCPGSHAHRGNHAPVSGCCPARRMVRAPPWRDHRPTPARRRPGRRHRHCPPNRVELLAHAQAFDAPPRPTRASAPLRFRRMCCPILIAHMAEWAGPDRVFVGRDGRPMRGDASARPSPVLAARQICQASASMTCGTPVKPSPPLPAQR